MLYLNLAVKNEPFATGCFLFLAVFHVFSVGIIGRPWARFFQWHPLLMSLALGLLMPEAVTQVNRLSEFGRRFSNMSRVTMHMIVQSLSVILIFLGLVVAVIHKERTVKIHLTSYHSYFGLLIFFYTLLQWTSGLLTMYPNLKPKFLPNTYRLNILHTVTGSILMMLSALTMFMGLTNFYLGTYLAGRLPAWQIPFIFGMWIYPAVLVVRAVWVIYDNGDVTTHWSQKDPGLPTDRTPTASLSKWKRRRVSDNF